MAYNIGSLPSNFPLPIQQVQVVLVSTDKMPLSGTTTLLISDFGKPTANGTVVGKPKAPTPFVVPSDYYYDIRGRLSLAGQTMRGTLQGTASLIIDDDFTARSRVTLSGGNNN